MPANHALVPIVEGEAHRLADMNGVMNDLQWVAQVCEKIADRFDDIRSDTVELEAYQAAAIIRYGRCYKGGVRTAFLLDAEWIRRLTPDLQEAHRQFDALRDKHIAHSVNDWEINTPVAQIRMEEGQPTLLEAVNVQTDMVVLLSSAHIRILGALARGLHKLLGEEFKNEQARLLEFVGTIDMQELEARLRRKSVNPGSGAIGRRRDR
jgi:hypothetical protein